MAAVLLLASSCSLISFGYGALDNYLAWTLNRYLDLEDEQKDLVRQRLKRLMAWHRHQELPEYAQWLNQLEQELSGEVNRKVIDHMYEGIRLRFGRLARGVAPDMGELATTLKPEQLKRLSKKLAEDNDSWRDDYVRISLAEQREKDNDRITGRAEYWLGSLSAAQKKQIRTWNEQRTLNPGAELAERESRQQELMAVMQRIHRDKLSKEQAQEAMVHFVGDVEFSKDPARLAYYKTRQDQSADLTLKIWSIASAEQKDHCRKKLRMWADDVRKLAAKG